MAHVNYRQHKAYQWKWLEEVVPRELGSLYSVHGPPPAGHGLHSFYAGSRGGGGFWCKLYGTGPIGEECGGSVAHPVIPSIEDRSAVPDPTSS